jgi:hypothetical protein
MSDTIMPPEVKENTVPAKPAPGTSQPEKPYPLEYIREAQVLVAYAAQQGLEIDKSLVSVIVNSRYQIEHEGWNAEQEIQFWMAFDTIAKLVRPVSVVSLKALRTSEKTQIKKGKIVPLVNAPAHIVTVYQRWAFWVLLALLIVQIHWLFGSAIISAVTKEIPAQLAAVDQKIQTADEAIKRAKQEDNEANAQPDIAAREQYLNEKKNLEDSKNAYYDSLRRWSKALCLGILCARESEEEYTQKGYIKARQMASIVLQPIQLYILPLLYGLLGASAFVLRSITREIKELTYTPEANVRYRLRIQLGALAGLAVGWFLFVPAESAVAGSAFSVRALSPMALSFLAGYSVELLFAAMDRLIAAFSTDSASKR